MLFFNFLIFLLFLNASTQLTFTENSEMQKEKLAKYFFHLGDGRD